MRLTLIKTSFLKLIIGLILCSKSLSIFGQSSVIQYSDNYFSAGVNTQNFDYIASIGKQRADNWCWAACIQMVLNYHGLYVTQEQIVTKCKGGLYNAPGGTQDMLAALNGWAYNTRGGASNIYTNNYSTNANEIQVLLANNWPLIVGLNRGQTIGHAYVLTAIYYSLSKDNLGNLVVIPDKVVLRDPWPENSSRQEMSWEEFSKYAVSIYKVWVIDVPTYNSFYFKSMNYNEINDYKFMLGTNFTAIKFMTYLKHGKYGFQAFWGRFNSINKYGLDCRRVFRPENRWTHLYFGPSIRFISSAINQSGFNDVFPNARVGAEFVIFNRFAINCDFGFGYLPKYTIPFADAEIVFGYRF